MKKTFRAWPFGWCLGFLLAAGAALADTDSLAIRKTALVAGPDILLRDLVSSPSDLPEGWGDRAVLKSPMPGKPQQISITTLAYALQKYPDMSEVSLRGEMNISIQRDGLPIDFKIIVEAVTAFIEQDDQWANAKVQIGCDPLKDPILSPLGSQIEIRARQVSEDPGTSDYYNFDLDVLVDGLLDRTITVRAKVIKLEEFWVAAQPISRGKKLAVEDLRAKLMPEDSLRKGFVPVTETIAGFQVDRPLRLDQPLSRHFLQQPVCAERNEWIFVSGQRGPLKITLRAKALSDGRLGDKVMCVNELSKRRLLVQMTGTKHATIDY
ncbi:MAG: flagellar basal body P-ring formation chaperone FlgA [Lentisphaerota bacterium]